MYRCTNCGYKCEDKPAWNCPKCDGFDDDFVGVEEDDEAWQTADEDYDEQRADEIQ